MSSALAWCAVGLNMVVTFLAKGIGPALVGERRPGAAVARVFVLLPVALLSGLVVSQSFADGSDLKVGADTCGAIAAVLLIRCRVRLLGVVVGAALVTGVLRYVGMA